MDRVLEELRPGIEKILERELYPTYSYFRVYKTGDILHRHKDRAACEISLSLNLGYKNAKCWPLFIEGANGIFAADLNPGDALIYKGMECDHWREALVGDSAAQVFLHYVDRDGPHAAWRYDKRHSLSHGYSVGYEISHRDA
jgi:hypothetical protein